MSTSFDGLMTVDQTVLDWRGVGLCQSSNLDIFYPGPDDRLSLSKAKAICSLCPVVDRCFEHAMTAREPAGVWGGTDEWERRREWRAQGRRLRT